MDMDIQKFLTLAREREKRKKSGLMTLWEEG